MTGTVKFREANLRFRDEGRGDAVILLHGYLESLEIWGSFAEELAIYYRVISIDLPGHGQSGEYTQVDTMDVMADAVKHVLDHLNIGRTVIIGHSMGGYATLAFAEIFPEITIGYCLFHSHGLADSEDKKINRAGKKMQFININIPKAFADDNLQRFTGEVENAGRIAAATPDHGIICALEGMKSRPDRRRVLTESTVPVMIVAGRKDNYIPFEIYDQHFNLAPKHHVLILENSGHMGFIEEKNKALDGILKFLKKIY
jgi:pimeloyl-ACP methyl ester carboxylesterase